MKKTILVQYSFVSLALFLLSFSALAQQRVIGGIVQDTKNNPLEGATVSAKNPKKNTLTKANGKFELTVPAGKTVLSISFVGYQTKSVTVGAGESNVTVILNEASNQLNDVVIVGMQRQTKRTTVAAISGITTKEIQDKPVASVDVLLQGRVSGINVQVNSGQPGATPTVVVRGNSKVNTNIGSDDPA
jgi:imidazole glycerol phosphate synthase subunit HisF